MLKTFHLGTSLKCSKANSETMVHRTMQNIDRIRSNTNVVIKCSDIFLHLFCAAYLYYKRVFIHQIPAVTCVIT